MSELNFVVDQTAIQTIQKLEISANFEETKAALKEMLMPYKGMIVSEDGISAAKQDRAKIRKVSQSIDDYRKTIKRNYSEPLKKFEEKCKELTGICDEAVTNLDSQVKEYEAKAKAQKILSLQTYYDEHPKNNPEYMDFERVCNQKWTNSTYSVETAKSEIDAYIEKVDTEVEFIRGLDDDFTVALLHAYKNGKPLTECVRMAKEMREAAEYKAQQEQKRREAEAERQRIASEAREAAMREAEIQRQQQSLRVEPVIEEPVIEEPPVAETFEPQEGTTVGEEIHTVKIWVQGTREQLAQLSTIFHSIGIMYGAIRE